MPAGEHKATDASQAWRVRGRDSTQSDWAGQQLDVPMPQASGAQACFPVAQRHGAPMESATMRFDASHGGAPYVCLYGLAVLTTEG